MKVITTSPLGPTAIPMKSWLLSSEARAAAFATCTGCVNVTVSVGPSFPLTLAPMIAIVLGAPPESSSPPLSKLTQTVPPPTVVSGPTVIAG